MVDPIRIQRSRAKGARLVSPNGLPIVCVTRPSKWSNPFKLEPGRLDEAAQRKQRAASVEKFERALRAAEPILPITIAAVKRELCGINLACWCPLGEPCHADVLLFFASR